MRNPTHSQRLDPHPSQVIDRGRPVAIEFDNRRLNAYEGDTVASALYVAGVRTFSRSFKYHRPRGSIIAVEDELEKVRDRRQKVQERLRRLGRAYVDGVYDDDEYRRQKRTLELELESLVLPEADAAAEAGRLIERLPDLWTGATGEERRRLLVTMLDAVYVDAKDERRIVAVRPKAPFQAVFQVATTREGSEVALVHDSEGAFQNAGQPPSGGYGAEADSCSWWRRGRVDLPVQGI